MMEFIFIEIMCICLFIHEYLTHIIHEDIVYVETLSKIDELTHETMAFGNFHMCFGAETSLISKSSQIIKF